MREAVSQSIGLLLSQLVSESVNESVSELVSESMSQSVSKAVFTLGAQALVPGHRHKMVLCSDTQYPV